MSAHPSELLPRLLPLLVAPALLVLAGCAPKRNADDQVPTEGLTAILVTPESAVVPVGGELQLKATGLYDDRTTRDVTAVVDWESDASSVVSVSNDLDEEGLLRGNGVGSASVSGSFGGVESNVVGVSVTDAAVLGLTVEPGSVSLSAGDEVQLTAWAAWSDGGRGDATAQVRWITDDGAVARLDRGLLTAVAAGETQIRATWDDVSSNDVPVRIVSGGGGGGGGGSLPDLRIAGVSGSGSGGYITLSVTVANDGDIDAAGFFVDAFLDGSEPAFGGTGDDYVWLDWVGAGDSETVNLYLDASDGTHTVWVLADTNEYVAESDEDNNVYSGSISAGGGGGSTGGPNLEITYFDYLSDDVSVYYFVDVANTGTEAAGAFYVDVFVDTWPAPDAEDDGDDYAEFSGLAAGASTYADFLLGVDFCWYYSCASWATVDSHDRVDETDETDNVAGPLDVWNE